MYTCHALIVATSLCLTMGGCGEDRREISQRTKRLAATIEAAPDSDSSDAAMAQLLAILNGGRSFGRCQAAYALKSLGPLAAPAVPDLIRAAQCADKFVEDAAIGALAAIGPAAAPAVDMLIEKVQAAVGGDDYSGFSVWSAAEALGRIGEPALKAVPVLEAARHTDDEFLTEKANDALDALRQIRMGDGKSEEPAER